jgi:hypothetical protein
MGAAGGAGAAHSAYSRLQDGLRRHRVKAARLALPPGPIEGLAQVHKNPETPAVNVTRHSANGATNRRESAGRCCPANEWQIAWRPDGTPTPACRVRLQRMHPADGTLPAAASFAMVLNMTDEQFRVFRGMLVTGPLAGLCRWDPPLPHMAVPMKSESRSLPNQRVSCSVGRSKWTIGTQSYKSMEAGVYEIIDQRRSYSPPMLLTLTSRATLRLGCIPP